MCVEVASDGAVVRGQHSAVHYVIRCLDAPAEFMVSKRNVKTILVIPGPRASKDNTVYWCIILELFVQATRAGRPLSLCRALLPIHLVHACCDSMTMVPCLYSRRRGRLKEQVGVVLQAAIRGRSRGRLHSRSAHGGTVSPPTFWLGLMKSQLSDDSWMHILMPTGPQLWCTWRYNQYLPPWWPTSWSASRPANFWAQWRNTMEAHACALQGAMQSPTASGCVTNYPPPHMRPPVGSTRVK